jgi:hypothetical protein
MALERALGEALTQVELAVRQEAPIDRLRVTVAGGRYDLKHSWRVAVRRGRATR